MHPSILLSGVDQHCARRKCTVCSGTAPFERFLELHHPNAALAEALADLDPSTWANMPSAEHARAYLGIVLEFVQGFGRRDRLIGRFIERIDTHYSQVQLLHSALCSLEEHPMFPPTPSDFGGFVAEHAQGNPRLHLAAIKGMIADATKSQPDAWHKAAAELETVLGAFNESLKEGWHPANHTPEVNSLVRDGARALNLELIQEIKTAVNAMLGADESQRPWPLLAVLLRGKQWNRHKETRKDWATEVAHRIAKAPPDVVKSFFSGAGSRLSCHVLPKFLSEAISHADDRSTIGWLKVCVDVLGREKAFAEFCDEDQISTAERRELLGSLSAALALAPEDSSERSEIVGALDRIRERRDEIRRQRAAREAERARAYREAQQAREESARERRAQAARTREAREARRREIMEARRRSPPYSQLLDEWLRLAPADRLVAIAAHDAHAPASAPAEWAQVPAETVEQIDTATLETLVRRTECVHKGHWRDLNRRLRAALVARGEPTP